MDLRSEDTREVLRRAEGSPSIDEETLERNIALVESAAGAGEGNDDAGGEHVFAENEDEDGDLPQCKIKRNYSCNLCPFFSQNPRLFLYHSRDVHFDRIKIYECSQCLYASKHSQKLQRHINMIHVSGKTRKARNKMSKSVRKEPRPIRPKPPDVSPEPPAEVPEGEEGEGEVEGGEEEEKPGKKDTVEDSEKETEYKCSSCNYKHKSPKLLRSHEKLMHLKKRYLKCNKCAYVTHVTARFTKHVKYHSMPMIKCDLCDFRTPYKWNLDRHYKNHSGPGVFQCGKCNFRADIKQSLTVHEMNHHMPAEGHLVTRRRNKVGGSHIEETEIEKPESEPEKEDYSGGQEVGEEKREKRTPSQTPRKASQGKRESSLSLQADFIHPDDIVPRYGQIYVKNLKCNFCSFKAVFGHEICRHERRIHGFVRQEGKKENSVRRPPPQLIPIQGKANAGAILKIPSVKNKSGAQSPEALEKPVNETEFNEMCKKSSLTSSLKDIVSLIGDEEGLKTIPDSTPEEVKKETESVPEPTDVLDGKTEEKQKQTDILKKKNASFFDKLKEKLLTVNNEEQSLFCEMCGHESKCLSEAVAHQKRHSSPKSGHELENQPENDIVLSGAELSSTRCQHCRQRCKTSTDLVNHLKSCKAFEASLESHSNSEEADEVKRKTEERSRESESDAKTEDENSMENRVFVWNDIRQERNEEEGEDMEEEDSDMDEPMEEESLATSPGYGAVTSKGSDNTESGTLVMKADPRLDVIVKKVFKCPHCPFWASTASRFHVHIVGHLNKKPFECSLCLYRSNWRWDITKHIRLKSLRDPGHLEAKVNMTDETGRRNYSKYNRYLTMMRVQEPSAESSGYGRRSRLQDPTQGNVSEKDILPLPAPPRLTRAPTPGTAQQLPQEGPLRPPPPLKAAHHLRPESPTMMKLSAKKTFWKCKKCNFRDTQKNRVLLHVKKHYVFKKNEKGSWTHTSASKYDINLPVSVEKPNPELKPLQRSPSYSCGHCHQVSNWKHVIQRHCKLKHNGYSLIQVKYKDGTTSTTGQTPGDNAEDCGEDAGKIISCDVCPFTTDTEGDLTAHKLNHVDRPGSIFKCTYCPFYVPSKIAVLEHMEVHGVIEGCDATNVKVDNFDPEEELAPKKVKNNGSVLKKYKCVQCPYISNSRTQFLYHKQFHRPRNSPFKCLHCSYNVSRRHLLHQHLRVHHNAEGKSEDGESEENDKEDKEKKEKPEEKEEPEKFRCPVCSYSCEDADTLESHLVGHMKDGKPAAEEEEEEEEEKDNNSETEVEFQPENAYSQTSQKENKEDDKKVLSFCDKCPARFLYRKELKIHSKFHMIHLPFRCSYCTYTARQRPHLLAHYKVHGDEYQEKTRELTETYATSPDHPREKTVIIARESSVMEGPVWSVAAPKPGAKSGGNPFAKHSCHRCPAKFVKLVGLQYHLTCHGSSNQHKCSHCDYAVKTFGNLIRHQVVHEKKAKGRPSKFSYSFPISGTDLLQTPDPDALEKQNKNKVKKYKCDKCPLAFDRRAKQQVHLSLHGSQQVYRCEKCDYSVKHYLQYLQHVRKHEDKGSEKVQESSTEEKSEVTVAVAVAAAASENQATLLQGKKKSAETKEEDRKSFSCRYCPYSSHRKDAVDNHLWRHYAFSGMKSGYECSHCDYSATQTNFLREHAKLHFLPNPRHKAEAYLKCEKMELWSCEEEAKDRVLIFRDRGEEAEDRFFPPLTESQWRSVQSHEEQPQDYDLLDMIEEQVVEDVRTEKKPKRSRGKNWKCEKCPHAFGKKDQYLRHVSLHGSNQKHNCDICDYSVKFYTNYVQHMRMHQTHEPDRVIRVKKNVRGSTSMSATATAVFAPERGSESEREVEAEAESADEECSRGSEHLVIDEKDSYPEDT